MILINMFYDSYFPFLTTNEPNTQHRWSPNKFIKEAIEHLDGKWMFHFLSKQMAGSIPYLVNYTCSEVSN